MRTHPSAFRALVLPPIGLAFSVGLFPIRGDYLQESSIDILQSKLILFSQEARR
jgi:hypothetical protein